MQRRFIPTRLAVRRSTFAQRAESLWLLWSSEPAEQRRIWIAATLVRPDERALRGLLTARRRGQLAGVVWYQIQSGRTAAIWPPRLIPTEDPKTADRLLTAVEELLDRDQTVVSQSLLRSTTDRDAGLLRRHGYWHAADLLYLVWDSNTSLKLQGELPLHFAPVSASDRERLVQLVERTYIDTRDIPALNDVRSVHDVLDGYYQVNPASRLHWFVVQHGGRDIGCLLATEHVENDQWELVYMGLVPEERGRGWGFQVARYLQNLAVTSQRSRVVLAVDAQNGPAISTYSRAGFWQWDRRSVFLRTRADALFVVLW